MPWPTAAGESPASAARSGASDALQRKIGGLLQTRAWYRLPRLLSMVRLVEMRNELREKNLHDTEEPPLEKQDDPARSRSGDARVEDRPTAPTTISSIRAWDRPAAASAATCRSSTPARHRQPAGAEPAHRQPRADDPRAVPAGDDPEPAGGGLDPVHGPRLVRAQALEDRVHRHPDRAGRRLGRALMRVPASVPEPAPAGSTRPPAYTNLNSHWWDASQIYGCDRRDRRQAAHPLERQAADRADRAAAGRSRDRRALQRLQRQLVDRPGDAAHALHARAQLHLRSARAPAPAAGTTSSSIARPS